jgi:hypothetical protein
MTAPASAAGRSGGDHHWDCDHGHSYYHHDYDYDDSYYHHHFRHHGGIWIGIGIGLGG